MNTLRALRSLVLLACLVAAGLAAVTLVSTSVAQARPCCWVYVCDASGACYHKCVACPSFP
jgi:hypothetical protein